MSREKRAAEREEGNALSTKKLGQGQLYATFLGGGRRERGEREYIDAR